MTMKPKEYTIPGLPVPSTSSARSIFQPPHINCSIVKLFKFKSNADITQPVQCNGIKRTNIVRRMLWKSSTQKLKATFLNGKRLSIQYIFDPTGLHGENVLIERDCLSPIFGGVLPVTLDRFSSISEVCSYVKTEVNLNECQDGRQAYCPCHPLFNCGEFYGIVTPVVDECLHQHFHHYCYEHVVSWFYNYLNLLVLQRESKELFNEQIAELYSLFPNDIVHFQTSSSTTSEFLLKTALEVGAAI
ncbi:repeat element protein-d11.2 [Ichnoviriform fugitivi]|uniref:Repeat element protein-d11.2 n=1 Tax=Ichnoviriform fugitivi TaxID=265522 RepID=A2Q0M9_9VIRU|nr:repeat element protein-d11.2 [Ichnoviriform fugitivi]BAF45744.1 repeat element protein-d11.2 [Ichnoviriform fugitivi]